MSAPSPPPTDQPELAAQPVSVRPPLESWRPDILRPVALIWGCSVLLISAGLVGTGLSMFGGHLLTDHGRLVAGLIGWPSALVGPLVGILGILRIVSRDDRVLQVCRQGLVYGVEESAVEVPWHALHSAEWSRQSLVLHVADREPLALPPRWLGIHGHTLALRLEEWRRRALLGVFRPPER